MFGSKLPNVVQQNIFTPSKVSKLVTQILRGNSEGLYDYKIKEDKPVYKENEIYNEEFDNRTTQIAAFMVKAGIQVLTKHYERYFNKKLKDLNGIERPILDPGLHPLIFKPLLDTITICDTILKPLERVTSSLTVRYNIQRDKKYL
jgi:hypothetical protein